MMDNKLLNASNLDEICSLYEIAFKKNASKEYFNWKYFLNPFGESKLVGIYKDAVLIGFCAIVSEKLFVNNKEESVFRYTDIMVNTNYRNLGVAGRIIGLLKQHTKIGERQYLSFGIGISVVSKIFKKYDFTYLGPVLNYFKPLTIIKIQAIFKGNNFLESNEEIQELSRFQEYDVIKQSKKNSIEPYRSTSYLNYRLNNPRYTYKVFRYSKGDLFLGYAILSINKSGIAYIFDLYSFDDDPVVIKKLHRAIEQYVIDKSIRGVIAMAIEGTPFQRELQKQWFLVNKFKRGPLTSQLDHNTFDLGVENKALRGKKWNLIGLCYDDL